MACDARLHDGRLAGVPRWHARGQGFKSPQLHQCDLSKDRHHPEPSMWVRGGVVLVWGGWMGWSSRAGSMTSSRNSSPVAALTTRTWRSWTSPSPPSTARESQARAANRQQSALKGRSSVRFGGADGQHRWRHRPADPARRWRAGGRDEGRDRPGHREVERCRQPSVVVGPPGDPERGAPRSRQRTRRRSRPAR
jgi:hypothetical protein